MKQEKFKQDQSIKFVPFGLIYLKNVITTLVLNSMIARTQEHHNNMTVDECFMSAYDVILYIYIYPS